MPANAAQVNNENKYYHISNTGRDNIVLFNNDSDFETFINYLTEYLTPPADPSTNKKMFSVQGKIYHGVPHLPKNYHDKVNLVAFGLKNNSFNLLLTENQNGSVQSFIRSLCTRYSIYFNKKYNHKGSLFYGPYKSLVIENPTIVALLTYYLHKTGQRSSLDKYINSDVPRFGFDQRGIKTYSDFVEKYNLDETQRDLLQSVLFGQKVVINQKEALIPETKTSVNSKLNNSYQSIPKYLLVYQRPQELLVATTFFMFLLAFGLKNVLININQNANVVNSPKAEVRGASTINLDNYPNSNYVYFVRVNDTGSNTVNIYKDFEASELYTEATNGEEFEVVAKNDKWTQVKLDNGDSGFIETKYLEIFQR